MNADGKYPGTGKESPFGNGKGASTATGPTTGGNDFVKNPGGVKTGAGNDFTRNPGGMKTGEGRDFTKGEQKKQPQGESSDLNTETSPSGELLKKLDAPASPERGAGSMGNPRKSYRLGK